MLSINMRIFKTVLLFVAFGYGVQCLPIADEASQPASIAPSPATDHYDQRQNGTENYRVHVDGLIFVVAPVEALLLAGAAGNEPNLSIVDLPKPTSEKPKPEVEDVKPPVAAPKAAHRHGLRLVDLILPLLRRMRHE